MEPRPGAPHFSMAVLATIEFQGRERIAGSLKLAVVLPVLQAGTDLVSVGPEPLQLGGGEGAPLFFFLLKYH